jgi:NAD(P)-dependent dehydrogenase (short-subunit alcohol dehydrogenase family)
VSDQLLGLSLEKNSFENQVVVVTGGAGALGEAVVAWFTNRGARVAVLDYSDDLLAAAFPSPSPQHAYIACDLTDRESTGMAISRVVREFGSIHVLANIAGGFMMGDPVHTTSDKTWDFLFDLNTRSVLNTAAAVVPTMLENGAGKVVNVAARAGIAGAAAMGTYTASKAAVMRLTESMALELREQGINVNAVMPSLIDTPRNRSDMPDADYSKWVKPSDIAEVIGYLASPAARAVHGACVPVDGLS